MRTYSIFLLFFLVASSYAQDVIISETIDSTPTTLGNNGPNLKHFTTYYLSYGQIVGAAEADASNIKYGSSQQWALGFRYKRKLSKCLAVGSELAYTQYVYAIEQSTSKRLPDSLLHKKEKYRLYALTLAPYLRINFDKNRGNYSGYFIDLGGMIDWYFTRQHITTDKLADGTSRRVYTTGMNYLNSYRYGIYAQLGLNKYIFYVNYFLSDLFTASSGYAEMPLIAAGIKLSFHK